MSDRETAEHSIYVRRVQIECRRTTRHARYPRGGTVCGGATFGVINERTGNLAGPSIAHAAYGSVRFVDAFLTAE